MIKKEENKKDLRVIKTENLLYATLIDLLKEKNVNFTPIIKINMS